MRVLPTLLLVLVACASPEREPTGRVRPVGELPPLYKETWVAWVDEASDWPQRREQVLADPQLAAFLVDNLARTMLKTYRSGAIAGAHDIKVGPFERSRAELERMGAHAVPTLSELMALGDGTAWALCTDVLVEIGRPAVPYNVELLARKEGQTRARAAELLGRLPFAGDQETGVVAALVETLEDGEWYVREAAAEAIGHRAGWATEVEGMRKALSRTLSDGEGDVARAAAFALARVNDPAAIPALLNFLERAERKADLLSYEAGQRALRALSRTKEAKSPREWRDWWRANRPSRAAGGNR